jgi:hypothetical protein
MSRLFAGIHFRIDDDTGLRIGRTVARWALCHDRSEEAEGDRRAPIRGDDCSEDQEADDVISR